MSDLINKLKTMFNAMALADVGDLDGVRDILRENEKGGDGGAHFDDSSNACKKESRDEYGSEVAKREIADTAAVASPSVDTQQRDKC
ncbi:MAG: hypothetical protein CO125_02185 [Hydrogenophilales bacterium CG_4_9_14_3_um_filter_59_35]|nr:MAG: hypothetical protein COW70_08360 [Hydrogenophilales bacterium CG18_big_fil_WC_8_21_14_2_50_58_12]PIX98746.1 MAG: hypothetical protein COZ23_13190 [Hydrogenophilales bacterium CG_4_10_14_3_um_filter_58_23]PJB08288.1 MAG: hypothetical protein CO125_02185 [Hydrogenophilales bacterium CG_4_9_14_3_um_filter_59_35]